MIAKPSAPLRTAGSIAPCRSIALRSADVNSINRAIATFNRRFSISSVTSCTHRATARRTARSPGPPPHSVAPVSAHTRQARAKKAAGTRRRHIRPVDVVLGRTGEDHRDPDRVYAVPFELVAQVDQIAQRLRHRLAVQDHLP